MLWIKLKWFKTDGQSKRRWPATEATRSLSCSQQTHQRHSLDGNHCKTLYINPNACGKNTRVCAVVITGRPVEPGAMKIEARVCVGSGVTCVAGLSYMPSKSCRQYSSVVWHIEQEIMTQMKQPSPCLERSWTSHRQYSQREWFKI